MVLIKASLIWKFHDYLTLTCRLIMSDDVDEGETCPREKPKKQGKSSYLDASTDLVKCNELQGSIQHWIRVDGMDVFLLQHDPKATGDALGNTG